ncbi:MAG: filamentous hemagglutinin N-terminal domain-containing protein [Verrucomicrobiota bacterium]|nr:filamentous hemagglutinin N-terminal domain-containing protein [Verrucomicrobiota bacterium]
MKRSGLLSLGLIIGSLGQAIGQVVVDNSFGTGGVLAGPNFQIPDSLGKTVGGNLFHSFTEFSVQTGGSATFTGPDTIDNILGRVTGGSVSEINGLIKSDITGANLYLMNPSGFLFGENAKVDVDGAFTVSSRDRINLGKDGVFLAVDPDQSVFTASQPQAFGFLGGNPAGKITFNGTRLVTGGQVNIAGGEVLMDKARLTSETADGNSGNIIMEADAVTIREGQLRSESTGGDSGKVIISSKGTVLIENSSATPDTGEGLDRGEFIDNIRNRDVAFGEETGLLSLTTGAGNTGGITIAAPTIDLKSAGLFSVTQQDADGMLGQSGGIKLQSAVTLLKNSRIQFGSGLSSETTGGLDILAQNGMRFEEQSYLYSRAELKLTGGVAIVSASLVEAGSSTVQLGGGMKLENNSAWNSPTIGIQASTLEVFRSNMQYETEATLKLSGDLKLAQGSLLAGNVRLPSTLEISGRHMTVDGGSRVDSGLGTDISMSGEFGLLNSSRVQVGIDREKNPGVAVSFPEGQQFGHLSLKAGRIAIAPGEQGSHFKLFTQYGGTVLLETGGVITIESNGEVDLTDYAAYPESRMTVKAGGMLIDAAGVRADEIDVDVAGLLQIGKPNAPYSSGITGGPKDPRLVDVSAGKLHMYGTGGIVLLKEGYNNVYGGEIKIKVGETLLIDNNAISTRGTTSRINNNNIAVGSIDIDAGNLVLQNNAKIEMNSGEVPEGIPLGAMDVDVANLLRIQNSTLSVSTTGAHSARADVSLSAKYVELTAAGIKHVNYFSEVYNQGDIYLRDKPEPVLLSGYGTLDITASATLIAKENTLILMQNGAVKLAAGGVMLDGTTIEAETHWLQDSLGRNSELTLGAAGQLLILNSQFDMETVSASGRQTFSATAPVVQFKNSNLTLSDEVAGQPGSVTILGDQSLLVEGSEISSIGMNTIDAGVNGNDITVGGGAVEIKSSVINTTVRGAGEVGRTKLAVTKSFSLGDSWIGGAGSTLGQVQPMNVATDDSWGEATAVGGAVPLDGSLGLAKGENQFFSLASLSLFNGQQLSFANLGDDAQRVIARMTGGESSVLDGTIHLGTKPADLVLMNPSGFVVGPNAQFTQVGALTLFSGNAVEFDGGVKVDLETAGEVLPETKPVGFITETRGDVQLIGATLGQAGSASAGSGLTVIGGDVSFRSGGAALTGNGGGVRVDAASLNLSGGSIIGTVSPVGETGGAIRVDAGTVNLEDGNIRTVAAGGDGGEVFIGGGALRASGGSVQSLSFPNDAGNGRAGAVTIAMSESITGEKNQFVDAASFGDGGLSPVTLKAATVVLDGLDLDRASGVQMIAHQGPTSSISIQGDAFASPMGRLINEARNDAALSVGDDYGAISITGGTLNLGLFHEGQGQKTGANNISFYTYSKNAGQTGNIRVAAENDLNLGGISLSQAGLLLAGKGFVESGPVGRGADVLFQGKNVNGQTIPGSNGGFASFEGLYTGNLTFAAEDQLTLGLGRYIYANTDPSGTHALTFKARNVSIGLDEQYNPNRWGTSFLLVHGDIRDYNAPNLVMEAHETITLHPGFQTNDDFDTVGPNKGLEGGHGVSAVDIQAADIVFNASKLSLHSNFEHRIAATGTLSLTNHSQIEIKDSDTVAQPAVKDITLQAGMLEMDNTTYLRSASATRFGSASWRIEAGKVQLSGARIFSESLASGQAGDIHLGAGELALVNGAKVESIMRNAGSAGSITAEADSIRLANGSSIGSGVPLPSTGYNPDKHQPGAYGDAGDISLTAPSILLDSGSSVSSTALDIGRSGNITLSGDDIQLDGRAYVSSTTDATQLAGRYGIFNPDFEQEVFRNGSITLAGGSVNLAGGSFLKSTTRMPYRLAGNISLTGDQVTVGDGSSVVSNTEPSNMIDAWRQYLGITSAHNYGNAGEVAVEAPSVIITEKSRVASDSFTDGDAGSISIKTDRLEVTDNGRVYAGALNKGNGGEIRVDTGQLRLARRGAIVADVRDTGDGGKVHIKTDEMLIDHGSVYGSTSGSGIGSSVRVETDELRLLNGGRIESAAFGPGKAGELDIVADTVAISGQGEWFDPKDVDVEPSGEIARSGFVTSTEAAGDAGTIHLTTPELDLDAGIIGSASTGAGSAGSINLGIGESILLQNDAQVSVRSAFADGGDITVQTGGQVLVDNSELSASAKLDGGSVRLYGDGAFLMIDGRITAEAGQDGGNIFVEAPETFVLQRSRLSANAIYGHGGYILIVAEGFLPSIETAVTASSEFGVQGTVEIRTPDSDVGSGLVILPSTIVTEEINLAERCTVQLQSADKSSFVKWGYGGVPSLADQLYLPSARFRFRALSGNDEDEE